MTTKKKHTRLTIFTAIITLKYKVFVRNQ